MVKTKLIDKSPYLFFGIIKYIHPLASELLMFKMILVFLTCALLT